MYSQLFPQKHGFLHTSVSEYCNIGEYCIIVIKLLLHWVNTRREGLIVSIKVFESKIIDTRVSKKPQYAKPVKTGF